MKNLSPDGAINAAMFSILDAIFFEPPPYARGKALYTLKLSSVGAAMAAGMGALLRTVVCVHGKTSGRLHLRV